MTSFKGVNPEAIWGEHSCRDWKSTKALSWSMPGNLEAQQKTRVGEKSRGESEARQRPAYVEPPRPSKDLRHRKGVKDFLHAWLFLISQYLCLPFVLQIPSFWELATNLIQGLPFPIRLRYLNHIPHTTQTVFLIMKGFFPPQLPNVWLS